MSLKFSAFTSHLGGLLSKEAAELPAVPQVSGPTKSLHQSVKQKMSPARLAKPQGLSSNAGSSPGKFAQGMAARGRVLAGLSKTAELSEAEKKRKRHEYYMRNRHKLLQRGRQYRVQHRADIHRKKKLYRTAVRHGARKQRSRISTGGHSWILGGYKMASAMPAAPGLPDGAARKHVKGLKMPRTGMPRLNTSKVEGNQTAFPFRGNWIKPLKKPGV